MSDTRGPIARQPVGTAGAAVEDAFHAWPLSVWEARAARVLDLEAVADAAREVLPGLDYWLQCRPLVKKLADAIDKLDGKEVS